MNSFVFKNFTFRNGYFVDTDTDPGGEMPDRRLNRRIIFVNQVAGRMIDYHIWHR